MKSFLIITANNLRFKLDADSMADALQYFFQVICSDGPLPVRHVLAMGAAKFGHN